MKLAHWASSHKRSMLFSLLLFAVAGLLAGTTLPVALFPHVDFPRIVVSIDAGDRPADLMAINVTRPLEQAIRSVPGVVGLRSISSRGSAEISINFNWGDDMISAMLQVDSAVNQLMPSLPQGTGFTVRRMDPTVFPVAAYSLTSDARSLVDLTDIGKFQLVPLLSSIDGVAKVSVVGTASSEYRVDVSAEKLRALSLTFEDVSRAISVNNVVRSVGRMEDHYRLYLLQSQARVYSLQALGNIPLTTGSNGIVRLGDVADIHMADSPQWTKVTADGHKAVLLQVYQQPEGNTVEIAKQIRATLSDYRPRLPKDLKLTSWYDQSDLILKSANSVVEAIAIGILLSALVLVVFLRSIKVTLIAIIIVPTVLATTALLLHALNMSFNIMTLGGMAAAVGLIVDDTIVMIEHIVRRLRGHQVDHNATIRAAAIEFTSPLAGSSAATIVIFAPLAFLSGVTGAFFQALSVTMACSLAISFLLAWLAVPIISEHLITFEDAKREDTGPVFQQAGKVYKRLLNRLFAQPWLLIVILLPLLMSGYLAYRQVNSGFMPKMDEGGFILDYLSPAGTSLAETDRLLKQVENILSSNPYVQTFSRRTGLQLGGGLTEANEGDLFIKLKPQPRPDIEQIIDEIRASITQKVPGLEVEMALLMEDLIGDLTAVPQPIEIQLYGDDQTALLSLAPKVAKLIEHIDGVVDIKDGIVQAGDSWMIDIDSDKSALEGVTPALVSAQLNNWLDGKVVTQIQNGLKPIDVRVWLPPARRSNSSILQSIPIRAGDGHVFPLQRVAGIHLTTGQTQIVRDNLKPMVAVTARISGRDLGKTMAQLKQSLGQSGLFDGKIYYRLGGLYQQQQVAFNGLIKVFFAALALVFLLLLYLYEQFSAAVAIIICPLLAVAAVMLGLQITDTELNITSMMGMTMIIGIVTEVSIFYFSEFQQLLRHGLRQKEALLQAGLNRLRPITMTTLAAILALFPLALAIGQGSGMQQPLAIAIIAGLLAQIPLVTLILPIIYSQINPGKETTPADNTP